MITDRQKYKGELPWGRSYFRNKNKDTYELKITPNSCIETITACCYLTINLGFNTDSKISPTAKTKAMNETKEVCVVPPHNHVIPGSP